MPALALVVVGTFAGHAVAGPNGLLAGAAITAPQGTEDRARPARAGAGAASPPFGLLDPRKADPDMADELVRKDLGLVRPDEVIVPLD